MKLIATPASPYSRKVRIVLAEKRIEYEFEIDSPSNPANHVSDYNPLGKIPVLVLDDNTALFDSRVIVEYLDGASPVGRLIPDDTRHRIEVKCWEALADGCTDGVTAIVMEKRRAAAQQSAEWLARQQDKAGRALEVMSHGLGAKAWCTGDHYNLSDIAVGCALGVLDFRMPELINWRKLYPNLARLADKLARRTSFKHTEPYLVPGVNVDYAPGSEAEAQHLKR
jgi:glutathione S-transferase